MKIVAITTQDFLIKEIKKSKKINELFFSKGPNDFFKLTFPDKVIILHHLDSDENFNETFKEISENTESSFIAIRNNPNNIEGCSLLKKGYKAYVHSMSNATLLDSVVDTVSKGNKWIYPELMEFLINSISINETKKNSLLKKLTVKELEVLELVSQGLNNAKIAKILDIAEITVKKHISSLFKKLDVKDRLALALTFKNP